MTDAATTFFEELGRRGHEPLLEKANGSLAFELLREKRSERWQVDIDHGDVSVSRKKAAADATVRAERTLFEGVARGEVNMMSAVLRGAAKVEGDSELLMYFQRVFPGPPGSSQARERRDGADDPARAPDPVGSSAR